jgi:hypothetical protein
MIVLPDDLDPRTLVLIRSIQADLPILENPFGSNRSPEIDAMCRKYGVPLGSSWCALWASEKREAGSYEIPPIHGDMHPARAESWHVWAKQTGRFVRAPQIGYATLYDFNGSGAADHIAAAVMSVVPVLMDAQGNTSQVGVSRNGELAAIKPVDTRFVLGYVALEPVS